MINDRDRQLLEFEDNWKGPALRKYDQVRRRFDLSAARYVQRILRLCELVDVEREFPQLVRRIHSRADENRRKQDARARALD
ncbi:DUF3263 domain-containing protein [Agreia sp. COWG]|uniref:DUF3263 domain-containing protein n=1 Tax=Agreia sp. COWG TaxID=2773266 RepID=UPI001928DC08|nr:DUF3263 domain-containing protein [Agreia sp. COWG]